MTAAALKLHRPTLRQVRLYAGLILGVYVTLHLANHAMGLISVGAQEAVRPWVMAAWQTWVGQIALYGSLTAHAVLGLYSIGRRRHFKMPSWERGQVMLGLAIPYLLLVHVVNTRGTRVLTGIDIDYVYEIALLWTDPVVRTKQIFLVLLVWGHFVTGLHFWLRNKPAYKRAFTAVVLGYVLLPLAALLGFAEVGMSLNGHAQQDAAWLNELRQRGVPHDPYRIELRRTLKYQAPNVWLGVVAAVFIFGQIRNWRERRRMFSVWYPRNDYVNAPVGMSILEVSRMASRPHVSVCGGRARCTTCRVRVIPSDGLAPPNADEARALSRIKASPGLRLACQTRPNIDVRVVPLLHASADTHRSKRPVDFGAERQVTVLFVDLRESTQLADSRLPYDVVYLVNQYLERMSAAVGAAGGASHNFTGDGLMALFGVDTQPAVAALAAVRCAADMHRRMDELNAQLACELASPLRIGVGVNSGVAVVGKMGPPAMAVMTALGDVVNTAARLEAMTKQFNAAAVVSADTLDLAGVGERLERQSVNVRGRSTASNVVAVSREQLDALFPNDTPLPKAAA